MSGGPPNVGDVDVILIPGFWLDASSWDGVVPAVQRAGHRTHPLTLPGLESRDADRSSITLSHHVDAVVGVIDHLAADGRKVTLVGHSGGGAVAHAAVDARPEQVARAIYVDSWPVAAGHAINAQLPVVNGEVPLPDWSFFDDEDLVGLDDALRAQFRDRAVPMPTRVAQDNQQLCDDARRYDVPVTVIMCEYPVATVKEWMAAGESELADLARITDVEWVELPTGHWPQFSRPDDLARVLVESLGA